MAIGLLVGVERGWRERAAPDGSRTAGIRTYAISGLLGGVFAAQAIALGATYVFAVGFLGFAVIFAWFKFREATHDGNFSVTGVIAGLCVFALGGLAVTGDYSVAAAGGTALATILASRELLHRLLRSLSWNELRFALILAVMTAIILPLLPNRTIDPWGGLNPWEIWFFTVLTAAISFAGYIAVRILGPRRGFLLSALAGAVVSSTAVTVALARTAQNSRTPAMLAGAAALAAMVSILRVLIVVLIVQPLVFPMMGPAALAAAATFAVSGIVLVFRGAVDDVTPGAPRNPFELGPLLLFAAIFAVVASASAAIVRYLGSASLVASSALAGTFDVDVAVLSALRLADQAVSMPSIGNAVLAALAANALGRLAMAVSTGPIGYWLPLMAATALGGATGAAVLALPSLF